MFRYISPEAAGWLGKQTVADTSTHPIIVHQLDFEFDGWMGDDILETVTCYIVTERLKQAIEKQALTGVVFDDVIISKSKTFDKRYPDRQLPLFYWLKVVGVPREDDFGIAEDNYLLISHEAFTLLKEFNIDYAKLRNDVLTA